MTAANDRTSSHHHATAIPTAPTAGMHDSFPALGRCSEALVNT